MLISCNFKGILQYTLSTFTENVPFYRFFFTVTVNRDYIEL